MSLESPHTGESVTERMTQMTEDVMECVHHSLAVSTATSHAVLGFHPSCPSLCASLSPLLMASEWIPASRAHPDLGQKGLRDV
jgi:predicted transcriptional regulator